MTSATRAVNLRKASLSLYAPLGASSRALSSRRASPFTLSATRRTTWWKGKIGGLGAGPWGGLRAPSRSSWLRRGAVGDLGRPSGAFSAWRFRWLGTLRWC
jgi:hypothetical protein